MIRFSKRITSSCFSLALVGFGSVAIASATPLTSPGQPATPLASALDAKETLTSPVGLRPLLAEFKKSPGIEARFTEEKKIALLAAPLKSTGKIYFHAPDSLARIVEKPRSSHLVMTGKKIVMKDKSGRKEVDLSDKPALRGLVTSLLHVLSGDEKKLLADFSVAMTGTKASGWSLALIPRNSSLKKMIRSFELKGKGIVLSELRVKEASGDVSVTRFSEVNTKRKFKREDIARYFGI